jgi:hypothetical protein
VFKSIARRSALALTFTLFAAPLAAIHAQSIVTGGNPVPTGESTPTIFVVLPFLTALISA